MGSAVSTPTYQDSNAYRILRVHEGSPAYYCGLQPYFDYIVKVQDVPMDENPDSLLKTLASCGDNPINLIVYNTKTCHHRTVTTKRDPKWSGDQILGVDVCFCNISESEANVWHVLEVYYGSPADVGGLRPYSDYIIGADIPLLKEDDLYQLIRANIGSPVKLAVYNSETDACREVFVAPSNDWSSKKVDEEGSLLGCGIGYGYLHRIPTIEASSQDSAALTTLQPETETFAPVPQPSQPCSCDHLHTTTTVLSPPSPPQAVNEVTPGLPAPISDKLPPTDVISATVNNDVKTTVHQASGIHHQYPMLHPPEPSLYAFSSPPSSSFAPIPTSPYGILPPDYPTYSNVYNYSSNIPGDCTSGEIINQSPSLNQHPYLIVSNPYHHQGMPPILPMPRHTSYTYNPTPLNLTTEACVPLTDGTNNTGPGASSNNEDHCRHQCEHQSSHGNAY